MLLKLSPCSPGLHLPSRPTLTSRIDQRIATAQQISDNLETYIKAWFDGKAAAEILDSLLPRGIDTKEFNLEGSIFEWVNEGHSVYQGEQAVKQVHPFSHLWGLLLNPDSHFSNPN